MKIVILGLAFLAGLPALAQTNQSAVEDFKASSLNQLEHFQSLHSREKAKSSKTLEFLSGALAMALMNLL